MAFGDLVKELRIAQKKTLRQFCLEHSHDPSNWSKLERGINPAPKDRKTLERITAQLGIEEGSTDWESFFAQASLSRGQIPAEVLNDKKLLEKLPVFFRSIRGAELTEEELDDLIMEKRLDIDGQEFDREEELADAIINEFGLGDEQTERNAEAQRGQEREYERGREGRGRDSKKGDDDRYDRMERGRGRGSRDDIPF